MAPIAARNMGRWLGTWALLIVALAIESSGVRANAGQRPLPRVPAGYVIELAAAPPLVEHPTMAGFDERGRLYVAENTGENLPADELLAKLPNQVHRLEDSDGDGVFDKYTVFADKLTFPMGALFHGGALYVASPPYIWRLEDTDDDGVADRRDAIVGRFGFIGNAADIHGCFLGPEGRIYWTDGRHGHNFVDAAGNTVSQGLAARVFSCRPDGSDVQVYCGGGMDNPVELAFTEAGDMIGTMTFYNPDEARHDALMHFVHGGVYPRKHACIEEFKRTGELLTAISVLDVVAPSGLMRCRGGQLGEEHRDAIFSTQFNTHKVVSHRLMAVGGTYASVDRDFLTSDDADFHPTDVLEDADGSMLVVDTGGWFRIGCPTSQVAKPDIKGAIYRIRRADAAPAADPWGAGLEWSSAGPAELAARLADARHAVRDRAVAELARRGPAAIPALVETLKAPAAETAARINAVWALARIGHAAAEGLREALHDADAQVRQAAARSLGTLGDAAAVDALCVAALHDQPAVRREAAAALGRIGESRAAATLLDALPTSGDSFVEHALIYALIEIDAPSAVAVGLDHPHPAVQRGALIAIDQMDHGAIDRDRALAFLESGDPRLGQAALDVIGRHPEWSGNLATSIADWLEAEEFTAPEEARLRGALAVAAEDEMVRRAIARAAGDTERNTTTRRIALEAMQRSSASTISDEWIGAVAACCGAADAAVRRQAVHTAAALDDPRLDGALAALGDRAEEMDDIRVIALAATAARRQRLSAGAFDALIRQFAEGTAGTTRGAAARALGAAPLDAQQLRQLIDVVAAAGPLELPALIDAYAGIEDAELASAFVEALESAPGVASLPAETLRTLVESLPDEATARGAAIAARLESDARDRDARLAAIVDGLAPGDASRGRLVFAGAKAGCVACHRAANEGGEIGPDLSRIGAIRTQRDLAESIVAPSASLARGYESFTVATDDGRVLTGVLGRETADAIHLRTADRLELRVPRSAIEEMAPTAISIMPQGFDRALSAEELADLIAYLQSLK